MEIKTWHHQEYVCARAQYEATRSHLAPTMYTAWCVRALLWMSIPRPSVRTVFVQYVLGLIVHAHHSCTWKLGLWLSCPSTDDVSAHKPNQLLAASPSQQKGQRMKRRHARALACLGAPTYPSATPSTR